MRFFYFFVLLTISLFSSAQTRQPVWSVEQQVDKFGDPIKSWYLMGEAKGTYSNKIVSDKPLTVGIGFYPDLGACFILMEGNYKANLYTGYNFSLDVKTPTGEEYGFWMVPRSGGRFFPCLGPTKKINKHEYWDEFSQFIELLKKEKYLKCYLIDNKYQSYTFKIDCIGFTKAYEKFLRLNNIESLPILSTEFLYNIPE